MDRSTFAGNEIEAAGDCFAKPLTANTSAILKPS